MSTTNATILYIQVWMTKISNFRCIPRQFEYICSGSHGEIFRRWREASTRFSFAIKILNNSSSYVNEKCLKKNV
jgi:hypothetical protein